MSHRKEQLASTMQRTLQELITRGLSDPRIRGMITVTQVRLTGDEREAVASISIFPEQYEKLTFEALTHALMHLQKELNANLRTRKPPHLRFELDRRAKKEAEIYAAIEAGKRKDAQGKAAADTQGAVGEDRPASDESSDDGDSA